MGTKPTNAAAWLAFSKKWQHDDLAKFEVAQNRFVYSKRF